jgi:hypothetical protein
MSAANYNMASSWTDTYVPPQLEQEYPLDNSLYSGLTSDSGASYGRRQQPSVEHHQSNGGASLSNFDHTFPPSMNDFTFTARQPSTQSQGMTNGGMDFLTANGQMHRQYSPQGSIFSSPPSATIQDPLAVGSSLTPAYGSYPGQVHAMRSSPSTPAPGGYSAPGSDNGYGSTQLFNGAYSPEQLQVNTNGLQPIFDPGHQHEYDGTAYKRMRPAADLGYDPDGDAEAEEGAPNGEAAKKPPGACSRCKGLKVWT